MTDEAKPTIYEAAVCGRREFRSAYREQRAANRRLHDTLDRIARFGEAFEAASTHLGHEGKHAGAALAVMMGRYAREALTDV